MQNTNTSKQHHWVHYHINLWIKLQKYIITDKYKHQSPNDQRTTLYHSPRCNSYDEKKKNNKRIFDTMHGFGLNLRNPKPPPPCLELDLSPTHTLAVTFSLPEVLSHPHKYPHIALETTETMSTPGSQRASTINLNKHNCLWFCLYI